MYVLLAGGSGFIGTMLAKNLIYSGHRVSNLTRNPVASSKVKGVESILWDGKTTSGWGNILSKADAVVNLAGENLGSWPWSTTRKNLILTSRVEAGRAISKAMRAAQPHPQVLIQASAVGYYGPGGCEPVFETSPAGEDFLAEVCKAWEASSQDVEDAGIRRVVIRTGIVLSPDRGAMPRMLLPIRLFAGGPLGNGRQGFSWIHPADVAGAIQYLIENRKAQGVYNLTAPEPLSNADFGRLMAKALHRPFWLPVPSIALRLLLGEMSTLVLDGQYAFPKRLQQLNYRFHYTRAEEAVRDVLIKRR